MRERGDDGVLDETRGVAAGRSNERAEGSRRAMGLEKDDSIRVEDT